MKKFVFFLLCIFTTLGVCSQNVNTIMYKSVNNSTHMYVDFFISGYKVNNAIFDTGCDITMLNSTDLAYLKSMSIITKNDTPIIRDVRNSTGQIVKVTMYNIKTIKVGNVEVHNVDIIFSNNPNGKRLFGQNIMEKFNSLYIDFKTHKISFYY